MTAVENVAKSIHTLGLEVDLEQTMEDLLVLLDSIRTCRQELATVEAAVEAAAARCMPGDRVELPGFAATRKGGAERKHWEHNIIADRVAVSVCTDPDTGEIDPESYQLATVVREALLEAAAVTYWRVGKLRALGVRFDDAVDITRGRATVVITRSEP